MDNCVIMEQDLIQIAERLLLNGTLTECPGLVQGKTGIAIFFFHYAKHTNNTLFADYAMDLIVRIQSQLHFNSPADYAGGIAGIGVGLDYLVRNNLLEAEADIFEDLDQRMYRAVIYEPRYNFSLLEGLTGYGKYWISRLRREPSSLSAEDCLRKITEEIEKNRWDIPLEEQTEVYCFLHDLLEYLDLDISVDLLEQFRRQIVNSKSAFSYLSDSAVGNLIRKYQYDRYFSEVPQNKTHQDFFQIPDFEKENTSVNMGLLTGCAGDGLLRLTALDQTNELWMQLF